MEIPCVRVERERCESARRELAAAGILETGFRITGDDGWLYIPVTNPEMVPSSTDIVVRPVERRETQTMPQDLLEFEPSYERLGDIVLLDEDDDNRAQAIADAIMASDLPVSTVVNRASKVRGRERIRRWTVLAGSSTETVHREYGFKYRLDIARVYFSPRLATERHRVTKQVCPDETVFDMFAGVGPFIIPSAAHGATCIGVDINEIAIEYLEQNARMNTVGEAVQAIHADIRSLAPKYRDWADRIIMNLPHKANEYLESAEILAGDVCMLHYYDIQPEDDPYSAGIGEIHEQFADEYDFSVVNKRNVRSYAPRELNICLDIQLTRR